MTGFVKKFNLIFFLFTTFIFLIAVFWLYQKHTVGNDSTISEWMINFQGGFTRRGIIGEVSYQLANFFELNLRFIIFLFQSIMYLTYSILIYFYIKNVPKNTLTIIAIFSPIFLLYPIAEIEVLARKEIFLYLGFIVFLNLSSVKYSKNTPLIYVFFIFPLLCLIWEPFIFFFSFAAFIILVRNIEQSFKKIIFKILLSFSSSILTVIIIFLNPLSLDEYLLMEESLKNDFGEICYMSCLYLKNNPTITELFDGVFIHFSFEIIFRYTVIIIVGFFALYTLVINSELKKRLLFINIHKYNSINVNLLVTFVILLLPSLILFSSMTDWGRAVNMVYTFSILTYIYLIKNNLVIINKKIIIYDNFYNHKKKTFIILFIIFAFFWNQKTALTGDISTNSLYKIVYNTSKKIFNFGSIRLLQDSPIIEFHRKYVE